MKNPSFVFSGSDDPLNLSLVDKPIDSINDDEVIIKNLYCGLNPVDYKLLSRYSKDSINKTIGLDAVGIVVKSSDNNLINKKVAYHTDLRFDGCFAKFAKVKSKALNFIDDDLDDSVIASLICPGFTAMQAFNKIPNVKDKDILVYGAGGSVGRALTSILVLNGANVYIASSKRHHDKFLQIGVKGCFEYDTIDKSIVFDAIFDTANKAKELMPLLGYYGHMVCILDRIEKNEIPPFTKCISLHEIALGAIHSYGSLKDFKTLHSLAKELFDYVKDNKILLPDIKVIEFNEIPKALSVLKNGANGVKFIAKVDI